MPPLTSPEKTLSPALRLLLLAVCVLIFAFTLHAKVAVYNQSSQPQTSTSAKLWLNGEKTTIQPISPGIGVLWFATLVVWLFCQRPEMRPAVVDSTPAMLRARQFFLYRFLRPPPIG
jgi:hypothetical protein